MDDRKKTKRQMMEELSALRRRVLELESKIAEYEALKVEAGLSGRVATDAPQELIQTSVLVVDDNDVFRGLVVGALEAQGYKVLEAGGSSEALRVLDDHGRPVDLIITDVVMPEVGGNELVRLVKQRYPRVKVLFISGYTDEILVHSDVQDVIDSKASFLQKPFLTEELLKIVRRELDKTD